MTFPSRCRWWAGVRDGWAFATGIPYVVCVCGGGVFTSPDTSIVSTCYLGRSLWGAVPHHLPDERGARW